MKTGVNDNFNIKLLQLKLILIKYIAKCILLNKN